MKKDNSLLYACFINDTELVKERLQSVKPSQLKKSTIATGTPLHAAAKNENKEMVDLLLEAGTNIEAGNFLKDSPLLSCIENGQFEMAKYLIAKGANVNKKGCQNRHALSKLILYSWDLPFAKYLLQMGCDINQTAIDKQSLLSDAAGSNNKEALNFLLENGIKREYLNSATCWSVIHNAVDAVRLLLDSGTDLDEMYASCKGIEKGLYHIAMEREGYGEMIQLLMERGVYFHTVPKRAVMVGIDSSKLSPLDYAKEKLQKFPAAAYIQENIQIIEGCTNQNPDGL
jgi:ankyrin repeat protein